MRASKRRSARAAPILARIGFARLERPVAALEAGVKGFLFDCRMCGDCVLSKTGMSCPMNCPKALRNGPCGGVRADGNCEVYPDMPCVWVKAYEGSLGMREGGAIAEVLPPVNHALQRLFGLAAAGAREGQGGRMTAASLPIRTTSAPIRPRRSSTCPAIPRAGGSSACFGAANSPSPPN